MKLRWAIVYVPDVEATISFYEKAFGLKRRLIGDEADYGEIDTGETRIGFAAMHMSEGAIDGGVVPLEANGKPQAFEFGFATDDVAADFKKAVEAGATLISEPEVKPWGQTVGYVRDLNGMLVEIASDMA